MFRGRKDLLELREAANRVRLELYECSEVNLLWSGSNILPCSRLFAVMESNGRSYVEQIGGKRLCLRSGCIYFLGAAEEYGFHFEYGTRFYAFHFDTLTPAGDDFFFKSGLFIEEPGCEAWIGMIDRIFAAPGEADNALRLKGMLLQKILNYLPQREKSSEKPLVCERELYTFLRNHANAQTTIADLAQIVGLSPDTFSRHFSRRNRIPVKQYLDHSIAARASRLLRDPALKIKDVAERLNFRSEYYFSRFYKRETSQTPSEFRNGIAPE